MKISEKQKLKHDFLNSIVVINSMTKSASSLLNKISTSCIDGNEVTQKQIEKILYSMQAVREQTLKIENYFQIALTE